MTVQNMFLGFGGTGAHILTYVKELAVQKQGGRPEHLEFLEFDTIANWKPGETIKITGDAGAEEKIAHGEEVSLDPASEYFHLKDSAVPFKSLCEKDLANPATRAREFPQLTDWLHSDWLKQHLPGAALNLARGAAQQRQIGRYAMFANAHAVVTELATRLQRMQARSGQDSVNVWIVGSAAGGTGAGCLIDAAYMVHLAGELISKKPVITAVVVLPEVYADVFDDQRRKEASLARSYSFFRELDRVQYPLGANDTYYIGTGAVASEVRYDQSGSLHARVPSKLFDYRVYLSQKCNDEKDRTRFFSSVANALDAFVDKNVGSKLLQDQNNDSGAPIGFGAARLVLPKGTYAERFAWRQVERYLKSLTTPEFAEGGSVATGFASGAESDRLEASNDAARSLLPLFNDLLEIATSKRPDEIANFARDNLAPRRIVEGWFQMAVANAAQFGVAESELRDLPVLLYCNPFRSLQVGADEPVPVQNLRLKTYSENQKARGLKEDQKSSGVRFAAELLEIRNEYLAADGGAASFEKGLRFLRVVNERRLKQAVDRWIMTALKPGQSVGADPEKPSEGTVLTRLYREISRLVTGGALTRIAALIDAFSALVATQIRDTRLEQNANDSVAELERAKKSALFQLTWIEVPQGTAREDMASYLQALQKQRLLEEMRALTQIASVRLNAWLEQIRRMALDELVRGNEEEGRPSALQQIRSRINSLTKRLDRISRNGSLLMSMGDPLDTTMDGYELYLERIATVRDGRQLFERIIDNTSWNATTDRAGEPLISLSVAGLAEAGVDGRKETHHRLYERMRREIDLMLDKIDVFDYLSHIQQKLNIDPRTVIAKLKDRLDVLLTVDGPRLPSVKMIYRGAADADVAKTNLARTLVAELGTQRGQATLHDAISNHSDPDSITLFTVVDPDGYNTTILDVENCGEQYLKSYVGFSGNEALRALTNHAFRAEEEAWFIERDWVLGNNMALAGVDALIPPRICRLLEQPAMMRAFVHCLATGAIRLREDGTEQWIYVPKPDEETRLGGPGDDLLQVAVIFVLQRRAGLNDLKRFTPETAIEAAQEAARCSAALPGQAAQTYPAMLKAAAQAKTLDGYADQLFRDKNLDRSGGQDREAKNELVRHETRVLKQIFSFYLPYASQTYLSKRSI